MRFLFACGGTAGHINPALAVACELRRLMPDAAFLFIGSGRELENRLIPAENFELRNIKMTGFARGVRPKDIKHNIGTVYELAASMRQAGRIIEEFRPDAVIGTGGYICYPVLREAARHKVPTVMHESNAVPGLTTKALSGVVDRVLVAFPSVSSYYKKPDRVVVTGTPVRGDFHKMSREAAKKRLGIAGKPLVVSFWGSLGADRMNHMMADFIRLNSRSGAMWHIHATGNGEEGVNRMVERLGECGVYGLPQWEDLRPYINNMGEVMTAADLVICRAGASTLAEITNIGRASILVPSPNVTNDHQTKNARELERAGGAVVITEESCSGQLIYNNAVSLLRDRDRLAFLERNAAKLGQPDATSKIAGVILSLIN